jgi:hypothetical protein
LDTIGNIVIHKGGRTISKQFLPETKTAQPSIYKRVEPFLCVCVSEKQSVNFQQL